MDYIFHRIDIFKSQRKYDSIEEYTAATITLLTFGLTFLKNRLFGIMPYITLSDQLALRELRSVFGD